MLDRSKLGRNQITLSDGGDVDSLRMTGEGWRTMYDSDERPAAIHIDLGEATVVDKIVLRASNIETVRVSILPEGATVFEDLGVVDARQPISVDRVAKEIRIVVESVEDETVPIVVKMAVHACIEGKIHGYVV